MKGIIYKYTFPDGKVYIGQTIRPLAVRDREHKTPSTGKFNVGFWKAWQEFGKVKLETLEILESADPTSLVARLNFLEKQYIQSYRATDPKYGYNRIQGGFSKNPLRTVVDQEFKKRFPPLWNEREQFYQRFLSRIQDDEEDWPIKLSDEEAAVIRDILPDMPLGHYIQLTNDNELSFFSPDNVDENDENEEDFFVEEAYEFLVCGVQNAYQAEKDEVSDIVIGYILENYEQFADQKKILKIDQTGTIIKEYSSINDVMHDLNLHYAENIYNALEGKQKTAYGYIWKWKGNTQESIQSTVPTLV